MEGSDLSSLYARLDEEIRAQNHEAVLRQAEKILQKQPLESEARAVQGVALVKWGKYQQLESLPPARVEDGIELQFARLYALYKLAKYDELLRQLDSNPKLGSDRRFMLLRAQALFKLSNFVRAAELYAQASAQAPREEQDDLLVNLLAASTLARQDFYGATQEKAAVTTRETLFNLSLLHTALGSYANARGVLQRLLKSLGLASAETLTGNGLQDVRTEDREDAIMAALQLDYIESLGTDFAQETLELKLKLYEEQYLATNFAESNLKAVLHNNLVSLRAQHRHEHFGESAKLLENAISSAQYRQTEDQLLTLKLNKALLLLNKNRFAECAPLLNELENSQFVQEHLPSRTRLIAARAALLLRSEQQTQLEAYLQKIQFVEGGDSAQQKFNITLFAIKAEVLRQSAQSTLKNHAILELFTHLQKLQPQLYDDEIVCGYVFSLLSTDRELLNSSQAIVEEIRKRTRNFSVLEALGQIYRNNGDAQRAADIYEKILQQAPQGSQKYRLRLAQLYAETDPAKAEALLADVEIPDLITDFNELSKLESEIALSKIRAEEDTGAGNAAAGTATPAALQKSSTSSTTTVPVAGLTKKISKVESKNTRTGGEQGAAEAKKKKRKRRIRYPKGFDAEHPPQHPPNPERWLPKHERKEWKKKNRGQLKSRTQGSAMVGEETKGNFDKGASTAHQDVSSQGNKRPNQRGRKRR